MPAAALYVKHRVKATMLTRIPESTSRLLPSAVHPSVVILSLLKRY